MGLTVYYPDPADRYVVCTSTTRPGLPFNGLMIYETDTKRVYIHSGTEWKYQSGGEDPIKVRTWRSAAFTLTVGTSVIIPFDNESWDIGGNCSAGVYTAPESCKYRINVRISTTTSAASERFLCNVGVNSAEAIRGTDITTATAARATLELHGTTHVNAGSTITFLAMQVNGTARAIETGPALAFMEITRA
jgi:hypothetical protein